MGNLQSMDGRTDGLSKAELERMERRCGRVLPPPLPASGVPSAGLAEPGAQLFCAHHRISAARWDPLSRSPSPHTTPPPTHSRLKRLGRGEKELARSDFQMIPELAGNPFLPRIFEMLARVMVFSSCLLGGRAAGRQRAAAFCEAAVLPANRPVRTLRLRDCIHLLLLPTHRYDTDGDGYMNAGDLRALLESLGRLARSEEERYQCAYSV